MAIFGNLSDMPLPDVLSMVGRSTGRFKVSKTSSNHNYELHLDHGMLKVLMVDQEPISDVFQLRNRMTELMNLKHGEFEFERTALNQLVLNYHLSIDMLLLAALAALDEVAAYRAHLPNCQTVFQTQPSKEAWLEGDLLEFWQCSGHLLAKGTSADKIAEETSLFTDHILLCLYKLRMAGIIVPVRAFEVDVPQGLQSSGAIPCPATTPLPDLDWDSAPQNNAPVSKWQRSAPRPSEAQVGIFHKIMHRLRKGFTRHA